jgi:hypothetical protein
MYKNVASQKVAVFAWDNAAGVAKTGDSANISAEISLDGGVSAATDDAVPTELDATDHPGIYIFDMHIDETDADLVVISAVSVTADIVMRPVIITPTLLVVAPPTADAIWDATEALTGNTLSYETLISRIYRFLANDMLITDATGAVALRNEANNGDIATQTITDDDTTTTRTDLVWS